MNKSYRKWFKRRLDRLNSLGEYELGETVEGLAQRLKIRPSEIVKLNANENFFIPREKLATLLSNVIKECDPRIYLKEAELKTMEALGKYLNVPAECIVLGNGSDQLIDLIVRLFLEKNDVTISIMPTFSMYQQCVCLQGAKYIGIPLKSDFSLDAKRIVDAITPKARLLFLCSPNNPTANQFGIDEILFLIEKFPGIVVVDEAYTEFANYSIVQLVQKFENLVVLRTFSKAFCLAGLRLGYATANSNLAKLLWKAQLPYNVSSMTLKMGLKLLENIKIVKRAVEMLKKERGRLIKELNRIDGVKAFDSQTNFVLFQTRKSSKEIYEALLKQGILVKHLGKILDYENCLRTTVGLPKMNNKLLMALEKAMR